MSVIHYHLDGVMFRSSIASRKPACLPKARNPLERMRSVGPKLLLLAREKEEGDEEYDVNKWEEIVGDINARSAGSHIIKTKTLYIIIIPDAFTTA